MISVMHPEFEGYFAMRSSDPDFLTSYVEEVQTRILGE
jgi:hypothetical protein